MGVSDTAVLKRIANGSLSARKSGDTWQIRRSDIPRKPESGGASEATEVRRALSATDDATETLNRDRQALRGEVTRLHARIQHLETMNERLAALLAAEQARRMSAGPVGLLRRLFRRNGRPSAAVAQPPA
jgi:hypothetical protein